MAYLVRSLRLLSWWYYSFIVLYKMNEQHKEYLDALNDVEEIDMFRSDIHVMREFEMTKEEARELIREWIQFYK